MTLSEIKPGQILVSNSQYGSTFVQVADVVNGRFGTHLACAVLNSERQGEFESVHTVGPADMRGIGWKLPTAGELSRMANYVTA